MNSVISLKRLTSVCRRSEVSKGSPGHGQEKCPAASSYLVPCSRIHLKSHPALTSSNSSPRCPQVHTRADKEKARQAYESTWVPAFLLLVQCSCSQAAAGLSPELVRMMESSLPIRSSSQGMWRFFPSHCYQEGLFSPAIGEKNAHS